jgi:hypothetical protein
MNTRFNEISRTRPGVWWFALAVAVVLPLRRAAAEPIAADKLPEAPLADPKGPEGDYLKTLHAHIHKRWADNFLRLAGEKLPPVNPLNQPGLTAEADVVVAPDGQLYSARITRGSGFAGFDDAILEVLRDSVPFPRPPGAVRSDDDRFHGHWVFARDQRRCAGVAVLRTYDPVEVALPKLLRAGRRDEALKRVAMTRGAGLPADPMFTLLAADWIKAAIHQPWATVRMARLLAERGDDEGQKWLKNAVRRPELAGDAGAVLVAVKAPLCPLLKTWFDSDNWSDHQVAAVALANATDPACAPGLVKLLQNAKARPEARAAAAVALGSIDSDEARKALAAVAKEDPGVPAVRAAAMLAQIKPNAGRPKVIAMEKFLRDPAPEMRAAAAAGVVRAGGSSNLDDLYVLFKDTDARPALAARAGPGDVRRREQADRAAHQAAAARRAEAGGGDADPPQRARLLLDDEVVSRREGRSGAARAGGRQPRGRGAEDRRDRRDARHRRVPGASGARRARAGNRLVPRARRLAAAGPAGRGDGRMDRDGPLRPRRREQADGREDARCKAASLRAAATA